MSSVFSLCSAQVKVFVTGLFSLNQDIPAFKEHLRDFLVQIKVRDDVWWLSSLMSDVCLVALLMSDLCVFSLVAPLMTDLCVCVCVCVFCPAGVCGRGHHGPVPGRAGDVAASGPGGEAQDPDVCAGHPQPPRAA